jgi:hypothetical protein
MKPPFQNWLKSAQSWSVTLLLMLLACSAFGQSEPAGGGRWLLIFDTSAAMKKRLPATETAVKQFFANRAGGELQAGDSVAVWTFDRQVAGKFPPFAWSPERAALTGSNLTAFLRAQRYQGESRPAALRTPMDHVVAGSRRLTIILFCDGENGISGTPYDQDINQTFRDTRAERRKSREPLVVVFRSQFGKFTGHTVNFPPNDLKFPPFPPLPPPPPVVAPPKITTVAPPPVPALVIVGSQVSTNPNAVLPPPPEPAANSVVSPPTNAVVAASNPVVVAPVAPVTNPPVTNEAALTPPVTPESPEPEKLAVAPAAPATNVVAATAPEESDPPSKTLIDLGIALLAAAGALAIILLLRPQRRPRASLITRSMQDDPRRK